MGLGFIGTIQGMFMLVSGLMGSAMAVEFILARMVVSTLENSSGVLNMDLVITISGKVFFFCYIFVCCSLFSLIDDLLLLDSMLCLVPS